MNLSYPFDGSIDWDRNILTESGSETRAQPRLVVVPAIAERRLLRAVARVHALVGDPEILKEIIVYLKISHFICRCPCIG